MSTYQTDFYGWALETAEKIRAGSFAEIDREAVAEEIESLGRSERYELGRHMELYLMHRLKWDYQPERRSRSWTLTMEEQRRQVLKIVRENPSLKPFLEELFSDAYVSARVHALIETDLSETMMPQENTTYLLADCFPGIV